MAALFVDQLTTLDFSYLCPRRGLVGETWLVDVELAGELDEQGMVFDFGHVKKQVKASLDRLADHRLLVPAQHPAVNLTLTQGQIAVSLQTDNQGLVECKAPCQAILLVDAQVISTASLAPFLCQSLKAELPANVSAVNLRLYPESAPGQFYHYSHGLKKHLGDCQRIAHGHRSQIRIAVDGHRDEALERDWAEQWQDIYLARDEDRLASHYQDDRCYHRFGYTADQGTFELTLAAERCYLMETDTTVELIAEHIARTVAGRLPGRLIAVTAYEGVNKGARAEWRCSSD